MTRQRLIVIVALFTFVPPLAAPSFAGGRGGDFSIFVASMSAEAVSADISQGVISQALGGVTGDTAVLNFDRRQRYTLNTSFERTAQIGLSQAASQGVS
jgi:membrane-bound lytic murein transglycosylase B